MTTPHRYSAYGLTIHSQFELAELTPTASNNPDLQLVLEPLPHCIPTGASLNYKLEGEPKWFSWPFVGRFELRDNKVLAIDPAPDVGPRYLAFAILGPIIAYILHARSHLVLHASAIGVGHSCVAFIAPKGTGKSTTAAACIAAGYEPVNDDVMAITLGSDGLAYCSPGFPQIKLKHDAAARLTIPGARIMPAFRDDFSKSQHLMHEGFKLAPRKVERIYVLKRGESARFHALTEWEQMRSLLANAYISLFARRRAYISNEDKARLLHQCAQLRRSSIVKEFEAPHDIDRLSTSLHGFARDWRAPRSM